MLKGQLDTKVHMLPSDFACKLYLFSVSLCKHLNLSTNSHSKRAKQGFVWVRRQCVHTYKSTIAHNVSESSTGSRNCCRCEYSKALGVFLKLTHQGCMARLFSHLLPSFHLKTISVVLRIAAYIHDKDTLE